MKHANKVMLGIVIAIAFLLGSIATPVAALQTNMLEETFNYGFDPGANNHTYIYTPPREATWLPSLQTTYFNEDTDLTTYNYDNGGWSSPDNTYDEGSSTLWNWISSNTKSGGPVADPLYLPSFYDFVGDDGSGAIVNTTIDRRSFSLTLGQQTAIAVESDYVYYGGLALSGQEFIHLTVASLQDGYSWTITVYDPQGRNMASGTYSDGNIIVLPFHPSVAGTYIVKVQSAASAGQRVLFEILPQAVTPQVIAPDQVITDSLPTSELILTPSNGVVADEIAPTAKTYKINPGTDVSSLTYELNYPTSFFGYTQGVSITFTSDAFTHGVNGGWRYRDSWSYPDNGVYYCRNGAHYVTLIGGDNIEFSLYHQSDVAPDLVVNKEFRVDNVFGHDVTNVYSLVVPEDSVMILNTTSPADFDTDVWATLDDGYYYSQTIADGSLLTTSSVYYLPAGEYIVEVDVGSSLSEWMEFTLQPLSTGTSAGIINAGGFIVPTEACHEYNLSIALENLYNVTVPMYIEIYNGFYVSYYSYSPTLGTWFDGSSQIPHSTYENSIQYDLNSRQWTDDHALIIIKTYPYNNTVGVGDYFANFTVDLTIEWEDVTLDGYEEVASIDASTGAASYNFTLDVPGTTNEYFSLFVNATTGTWYNVSITSNQVNSFSMWSYCKYVDRTHYTAVGDLNDALQGSAPDWAFQMGAISDSFYLEFNVNRNLVDGHFSVEITPLPTINFEYPETLAPVGPDLLGVLGGIAIPLGVGAVVIVVVAVVYVKKFKK